MLVCIVSPEIEVDLDCLDNGHALFHVHLVMTSVISSKVGVYGDLKNVYILAL